MPTQPLLKKDIIDIPSSLETPHTRTRKPVPKVAIQQKPWKAAVLVGSIRVGNVYLSIEAACDTVFQQQAEHGHKWRTMQSKKNEHGECKKVTFCCNHYYHHIPVHSHQIDPSDFCNSQSIKTGCDAHVNITQNQSSDFWKVTLVVLAHNHVHEIPPGRIIPQPPTKQQWELITKYTSNSHFGWDHITEILKNTNPNKPLKLRQISNVINKAHREAQEEVKSLGGDVTSILASLDKQIANGEGWHYKLKLDKDQVVTGLFWQSPTQIELCQQFSNILINDNTYNRNQYQYPLNIGIIIDNYGHSRNSWYAFQSREDIEMHSWVFKCHLKSVINPPEALMSDRHGSIIASACNDLPLMWHFYCLHHLDRNITSKLRPILGPHWDDFQKAFWITYWAVSPEEFDRLWNAMITEYPAAAKYLNKELYECHNKWAWAWVSHAFTAGVHTNGRVESENCINKALGGAKKTLLQVFNSLNDQTEGQTVKEMTAACMVSDFHLIWSLKWACWLNNTFPSPLVINTTLILRQYIGISSYSFNNMLVHTPCRSAGSRCKNPCTIKQRLCRNHQVFMTGYVVFSIFWYMSLVLTSYKLSVWICDRTIRGSWFWVDW